MRRCICIIILYFMGCSYSGQNADSPLPISIDLGSFVDPISCTASVQADKITVPEGECGTQVFVYDLTKYLTQLKGRTFWIRARVKSARERTAIRFNNSISESYVYHSGSSNEHLLLSEVHVPDESTDLKLRIYLSEVGDSKGEVEIADLELVDPFSPEMAQGDTSSYKKWARRTNPNIEFNFRRYTSQLKNFAVTVPTDKYPKWEAGFGLGVNDRFNTGDYFCFPDDMLIVKVGSTGPFKIFLGALPWIRTIDRDDTRLVVRFSYSGPLVLDPKMKTARPEDFDERYFLGIPRSIRNAHTFSLVKEYEFHTDMNIGLVRLEGKIQPSKDVSATWVVADSAYMDFATGSTQGVESLLAGAHDQFGMVPGSTEFSRPAMYRIRNERASLAAAYVACTASFAGIMPNPFPGKIPLSAFLPGAQISSDLRGPVAAPKDGERAHFIGYYFKSDGSMREDFHMLFTDAFQNAKELDDIIVAQHAVCADQ